MFTAATLGSASLFFQCDGGVACGGENLDIPNNLPGVCHLGGRKEKWRDVRLEEGSSYFEVEVEVERSNSHSYLDLISNSVVVVVAAAGPVPGRYCC
jgi:hypothetical protein